MEGTSKQAAGATLSAPSASERVELARLALTLALAVDGVVRADPGPLGTRVTLDGANRLIGVTAAALSDGCYAITLHLVARVVPFCPLADRIRARIVRGAARAGLRNALGPIDIVFEDVAELPGAVV